MEDEEASKQGLWKNFTETNGFHGLNKMTFDKKDPGRVIRSVCWAVVWLFSVAVLIYIITTELMNYYSYPWISSTYIRWDKRPPFPVVTLAACHDNTYDLSLTSVTFDDKLINISDVPVVEYTDFISFETFFLGKCSSRRFNANSKKLTFRYGRRTSLLFETTAAKELQIAVHSPEEEPEMYTLDGISVGEDTETFIEVHKREFIGLPSPFTSYGNQKCTENSNYSFLHCKRKCWNELLMKQCGCTMTRSGHGTSCYDIPNHVEICAYHLWIDLETNDTSSICACLPKCKTIKYDVVVSSTARKETDASVFGTYVDSLFIIKHLVDTYINYDFNDNYEPNVMVRVFFKDFTTTVTEQIPKYDGVTSLLANLGGQMGLFLGASILTMTELLEFIIFIMWSLFQRRSKRNVVQNLN